MKRLAIFDFDGTLFDSIHDVLICFNKALAIHDFPPLTREELIPCLGGNIGEIVALVLKDNSNSDSKKSLKDAGVEAMKLYKQVKASKTSAEPAVEIKQEDDTTTTKSLTKITKAKRLKPVRKQYRPHNLYRNSHRRR